MARISTMHKTNASNYRRSDKLSALTLSCCLTMIAAVGLFLSLIRPQRLSASLLDDPLTLAAISPTEAYNSEVTIATITGANFASTPTVTLGTLSLPDVTFMSSTMLTATIPADLPGGTYTVTVTNPNTQSSSLVNGFSVLLSGDGSLTPWEATTPLSDSRYNFAAVQAGDHVYALGGESASASPLALVEMSLVGDDGSLGAWQSTTPISTARYGHSAATAGKRNIYVVGGHTGPQITNSVEWAVINLDGSLDSWEYTSPMNSTRWRPAAVVAGDFIYAIGGVEGGGEDGGDSVASILASVEGAPIKPDGSLGLWQTMSSMTTARYGHAAVVVGNYIYAIAGSGVDTPLTSVERAAINPNGSLGPWQAVIPITDPNCNPEAVSAGGYIYVLGGDECINFGPRYRNVVRAQVNPDGSLGSWDAVFSMTTVRLGFAVVRRGNYIYAIGGEDDHSQKLSSVEYTEVTDGLLPTGHSISINDGALFTNEITVTLSIGAEPDTTQMQVSNDGGFAGAEWEPFATQRSWTITAYGSYVLPRTVYAKFKTQGQISSVYQDDIILDVTPPVGTIEITDSVSSLVGLESSYSIAGLSAPTNTLTNTVYLPLVAKNHRPGFTQVALVLSATDDVSGVGKMLISNDVNLVGAQWEAYATRRSWWVPETGITTVYVKFCDRAGNASSVYSDIITP